MVSERERETEGHRLTQSCTRSREGACDWCGAPLHRMRTRSVRRGAPGPHRERPARGAGDESRASSVASCCLGSPRRRPAGWVARPPLPNRPCRWGRGLQRARPKRGERNHHESAAMSHQRETERDSPASYRGTSAWRDGCRRRECNAGRDVGETIWSARSRDCEREEGALT